MGLAVANAASVTGVGLIIGSIILFILGFIEVARSNSTTAGVIKLVIGVLLAGSGYSLIKIFAI
jgi:hypothetical protein